jgi:hypothetical protein
VALTLLPCAAAVPGARSEPFSEWCGQQGIPDPLKTPMRDSICERMVSSAQLSSAAALARLVHQVLDRRGCRNAQCKRVCGPVCLCVSVCLCVCACHD